MSIIQLVLVGKLAALVKKNAQVIVKNALSLEEFLLKGSRRLDLILSKVVYK